jgi:hypothetical protein
MKILNTILCSGLLLCALGSEARAEKAWGVDSRALLVSFDTDRPQFLTSLQLIRGLQPGEQVLAIDFRPATGQLYALGSSSRLYTIERETAQAKVVGNGNAFSPVLDGVEFGFDFNPTVDRIRLTSNTGQNLRLHPDTGVVVATDAALNYADGVRPQVVASAYTNSFAGSTSTTLFNLDLAKRAIVTQAPPNDGVLSMVRPLVNIDLSRVAGFDISPSTNRGYLVVRGSSSSPSILYEIYYETGDHNPIGNLWFFEQFGAIAIEPPNAK